MSSAATSRVASGLGSTAGAVLWSVLAAAVALGGAGLTAQLSHPPGGPARAELTYTGDRALTARLDDAAARLRDIDVNVGTMSTAAKSALAAISSADAAALRASLERGNGAAVLISSATNDLRTSLAGLPGDGPDANLQYSNAVLVRRAQILASLDAALSLAQNWSAVTGRSIDAARVVVLLEQHDAIVADAAALGRSAKYGDAVARLDEAAVTLQDISALRDELVANGEVTILDEWVLRHQNYDNALQSLYKTLNASGGKNTLLVQARYRDEKIARDLLPADARAIIVIVAELARGGLNQAVLAIEDARGRIDLALGDAAP